MTRMGIYLYGVAEAKRNVALEYVGVANGRVYTIQYRDIGAVVSQIPEDYEVSLEDALKHETVLRKMMEIGTIIPISFGTIAKDRVGIEEILKRGYATFKRAMDKVKGQLQVDVTVSWNEKEALRKAWREDGGLRALRERVVKTPNNQDLRIEVGRRVRMVLDERRKEIVPVITNALQSLSKDFEENRTKDANTILNVSFLLDKSHEKDFYVKANELERVHAKEVKIVVVGPLPPYNFARIEIRNLDFRAVKEAQKVLGIGEMTNIYEMRQVFNNLVQSCHPDLHPEDSKAIERFGRIRKAYDALMEYCEHRLFSFKESDVEDTIIVRERPKLTFTSLGSRG